MSRDVYVAIWHLDTRADPGPQEPSWSDKLRDLGSKVGEADQLFRQLATGRKDADPIYLFTAPEYYFAMGGDWIRGYSADEASDIRLGLMRLSLQYPHILLVPGTIAWKELMDRSQRAAMAAAIAETQARADATKGTYVGELASARRNIELKGKNTFGSKTKTRWFGHNVAYVFYGGVQIGEIHKSSNAGEFSGDNLDPKQNVVMIPGLRSGVLRVCRLKGADGVNPLKVGVEICADHGRLSTFGETDCDIHILVSATQVPGSPYARPGGLFIHCDNQKPALVCRTDYMGGDKKSAFRDRKQIRDAKNTHASPELHVQWTTLEDST